MPSHKPKYGTLFKFDHDDVFYNRIKTFPKVEFFIYSGSVYLNNESQKASNFHTPNGHINLYEMNVFRNLHSSSVDDQMIYPFITKEGSFTSFRTVSKNDFNMDFAFGDQIRGNYPMTASISVDQYGESFGGNKKNVLYALKTTLNHYTTLSSHYAYSSSLHGDKEQQKLNIISIPSIFYGSSIEKGTVKLKYYVTGTLVAEAFDKNKNGDLVQTTGSTTGQVVGSILYNEGFIILTSSTGISTHKEAYETADPTTFSASWHYFGATGSYNSISSSYKLEFQGLNYIETMTMFAHARENQINYSNNPTFLTASIGAYSSSLIYHEDSERDIKNIVSSSYKEHRANFKPVTYISKIGIYDKDKNLIAIAGLANPVRKLEERSYTFKLKLDI